ncbi:MAG: UDP-N-acetylmuramate dehydrogenase [Candidatus Levybacteria bacterium]|nr:UDP-N-acetylmuramate dehydrogenase [Candidatus Levybacteria bacterium]
MFVIQQNISLKDYSNFKIGGKARYFLEVKSVNDILEGVRKWRETDIESNFQRKYFVLGGGTNVLFNDAGFDGLVIKNSIDEIRMEEDLLVVGAGVLMSKLLDYCVENSLSGLEWAGGLPGTVGGAVRGNAGAYRGETKDKIVEVDSVNLDTLEQKTRTYDQCQFDYRTSIFKTTAANEVITYIKFKLTKGKKEEIESLIEDKKTKRKLRHPLEYPNVGSIFKNVPIGKFTKEQIKQLSQYVKDDPFAVIPTAKINFLAGLSGKRVGDAKLSEKHTNFIVNLGNAKAEDVKKLIEIIIKVVREKFGIELEPEVMFVD